MRAGRYAQEVLDPCWRRIIAKSLCLRSDGAEGPRSYRNPLARRHDALALLDTTIEAVLPARS